MREVIEGLKPEPIWRYFYEISQIPRESKNEREVANYIISVAKKLNLAFKQDEAGNVLVSKPASLSAQDKPVVALQGHLDMVCEKNKDVDHDFKKDPIRFKREGGFIKAEGTTLGADNGIGVAAMLAVMESKDVVHPPLEFLFTVDEETGLTGASSLQPGFLKARTLLNCDSEEDGALYVGCSGGKDTEISFEIEWEAAPPDWKCLITKISGLKGGHSGLDIHIGRANAIKQLNRVIWNASQKLELRIYSVEGGNKRNAIPREAEFGLLINPSDYPTFKNHIHEYQKILKEEFKITDPELKLFFEDSESYPGKVFSSSFQSKVLNLIYSLPHGVIAMSHDIPDLVETSTNLAIVEIKDNILSIVTSQRSSVGSEMVDIADQVKSAGLLAGGEVKQGMGYPGWKPNMESEILKLLKESYQSLYGKEPEVKAVHAGLECGIIGEKFPGIDMVSFGPTIIGAHSPDERVQIDTVERFWKLMKEALRRLA